MNLTAIERDWVDWIREKFGDVLADSASREYADTPVEWDGESVLVRFHNDNLEVVNSLMDETSYRTVLAPLVNGKRLRLTDDEYDEQFTYFDLRYLADAWDELPDDVLSDQFNSADALRSGVGVRAAFIRRQLSMLESNRQDTLDRVAQRLRAHELSQLVPQWERFVAEVVNGFAGSPGAYRAGVNVRGAIRSFLKWRGEVPEDIRRRIELADQNYDQVTVPLSYDVQVVPDPRARRWWRMPEAPQGQLRDYLFNLRPHRT